MVLADQTTQVVDTNQLSQIIYQQNAQPAQIHTDGQIHYVVQEEDIQNDSYSLVSQPGTPQVFYSKIETENGTQLIPHTGKYRNSFDSSFVCLGFIFRLSFVVGVVLTSHFLVCLLFIFVFVFFLLLWLSLILATSQSDLTNIIEVNPSQVQYQQNPNVQQIQPQYQQIVIQNYPQGPQQVLVYPQIQSSSNQQQLVQVQVLHKF